MGKAIQATPLGLLLLKLNDAREDKAKAWDDFEEAVTAGKGEEAALARTRDAIERQYAAVEGLVELAKASVDDIPMYEHLLRIIVANGRDSQCERVGVIRHRYAA